jgi:DNA-binding NarL/FixJ family response regulator
MALASVLIVEDDIFMGATLAAALAGANFEVKDQVSKASDALLAIKKFAIDVAILDLDLGPGANGIDIAYALREVNSSLGVIILTSYSDPRVANPDSLPLPKGARFLTKSKLTDFRPLVKAVLELKHIPLGGRTGTETEKSLLTKNQLIVLQLVAQGLTTHEIAHRIGVSSNAIEGTITRLHLTLALPKDSAINPRVQLARAYYELAGKKPPGA